MVADRQECSKNIIGILILPGMPLMGTVIIGITLTIMMEWVHLLFQMIEVQEIKMII